MCCSEPRMHHLVFVLSSDSPARGWLQIPLLLLDRQERRVRNGRDRMDVMLATVSPRRVPFTLNLKSMRRGGEFEMGGGPTQTPENMYYYALVQFGYNFTNPTYVVQCR